MGSRELAAMTLSLAQLHPNGSVPHQRALACTALLAGAAAIALAIHQPRRQLPVDTAPVAAPVRAVERLASVDAAVAALAPAVVRQGSMIHITADTASRSQVAQRLAALTHAQLLGELGALADAPPLTLHWQGSEPQAAWAALLGDETNHALQCDSAGCKVWVFVARPATEPAARIVAATLSSDRLEAEPSRLFPVEQF